MLHTNQESPSKRLLAVACCVLTTTIWAQGAAGDTIFFDNFNDGNAGDGMPVTWVPGSGTWDASSGDYVATGSLPRVSRVLAHVLGDTSARTQARVVGNVAANLAVRRPGVNHGYAGVIRPDGSMTIAKFGDFPPVALGSAVVPFNPVQQDVMLQFDAFGDKLSLWAWPVGRTDAEQTANSRFRQYLCGRPSRLDFVQCCWPSVGLDYISFHSCRRHAYSRTVNFRAPESGRLRPALCAATKARLRCTQMDDCLQRLHQDAAEPQPKWPRMVCPLSTVFRV